MIVLNCIRGLGVIILAVLGLLVGTAWVCIFGMLVCVPVWGYCTSANIGGANINIYNKMDSLLEICFWFHSKILPS